MSDIFSLIVFSLIGETHICNGPNCVFRTLLSCFLEKGNTKITEQYVVVFIEEDIIWFDIPMNQFMIMGILIGALGKVQMDVTVVNDGNTHK
ncbi:hypothetical protein [Dictyobacter arantiisoli]|uniref:Uncharacterized protein n=1 Tax=Dictyobacter arantiisoli TaxID=2014874 RepID=A0A5A5TJ85_9CHLR|nr:hypothetical protein [Dictyobacter arantiisoli]GCF11670.1 hypothetical protein KDI_52340 [Dictyobacter arantiisoli]